MEQQDSSSRLPPIQTLLPSTSYPFDDQVATAAASLLQIRGSPVLSRPPAIQQRFLSFPDVQPSFATYPSTISKPFLTYQPHEQQHFRFVPQLRSEYNQYAQASSTVGSSYLPQTLSQPQRLQTSYTPMQTQSDNCPSGRKRKRSSFPETVLQDGAKYANDRGKVSEPARIVEGRERVNDIGKKAYDTEWEMRCICGLNEDDGYTIQCESCYVWQHAACFKIQKTTVPEVYLCERCNPRPVDADWAKTMQSERFGMRRRSRAGDKRKRGRPSGTGHHSREQENVSVPPERRSPTSPQSKFLLPSVSQEISRATRIVPPEVQPALLSSWRGVSEDREGDMSPITPAIPLSALYTTPDSETCAFPQTSLPLPVRKPNYAIRRLFPTARSSTPRQSPPIISECVKTSSNPYTQHETVSHGSHSIPRSLSLCLDEMAYDNDARREPNAVLRPILCRKNNKDINSTDHSMSQDKTDLAELKPLLKPPQISFGIFAVRDVKATEEIELGWEWDDRHVVHELPRLLREGYGSGSENLEQSAGEMLLTLLSSFTTCACGESAHNCAIAQMEKYVNLERDCEGNNSVAASTALLQHRVSSMRDQPQQSEIPMEDVQTGASSRSPESDSRFKRSSEIPSGLVQPAVLEGHDEFGNNKIPGLPSSQTREGASNKGKVVNRRGSSKHVHFPQSELESVPESKESSTLNIVEGIHPRKKIRTESPLIAIESARNDACASNENKQSVKQPPKQLNTEKLATEMNKELKVSVGLSSSNSLTAPSDHPLLSPSTALANLTIQCSADKQRLSETRPVETSPNEPESPDVTLPMKPSSTSVSSPETYPSLMPGHPNSADLSPSQEPSMTDLSLPVKNLGNKPSKLSPASPSTMNTNLASLKPVDQTNLQVSDPPVASIQPTVPEDTVSPSVQPTPSLHSPPETAKKPVRRRTLADWKSSKDKERQALKEQQEREAKEREEKGHKEWEERTVVPERTPANAVQDCDMDIAFLGSSQDSTLRLERHEGTILVAIAEKLASSGRSTLNLSNPEGTLTTEAPVTSQINTDVEASMFETKPSSSSIVTGLCLNDGVKDVEMIQSTHTSSNDHLIPQMSLSEKGNMQHTTSASEDGEIYLPSHTAQSTSQSHAPSRSSTPVSHSPSPSSSRPPSRLSSRLTPYPTPHSPIPRSPPRHPRSYRPPSPSHRLPPSGPIHLTDGRYSGSSASGRPPPAGPRALRNGPPFNSSYARGYSRPPSGPPPPSKDRHFTQRPYDHDAERGWSSRRGGNGNWGGFEDRNRSFSRGSDRQ